MALDIIIGAQWGDEGKGRITDLLAAEADIVARYSGGDNAGHTVTVGDEIFKLHLIPSGIIHDGVIGFIGNGTVLNPEVLLREMDQLAARGIDVSPERLKISRTAHLITPAHVALDGAQEAQRGENKIGTTKRGIGPAYVDKTQRCGLRAHLLATPEELADALVEHVAEKNRYLTAIYGAAPLDPRAVATQYVEYARRLAPYLVDGPQYIATALEQERHVLAEGAQGTLLDIDHGTYPFVTSSSPTAGGVITGLGVGPRNVENVLGIAKAFTTRVGSGPFPAEVEGEVAQRLRGTGENPWDEYGTTTGRPRRVGWLDTVMLNFSRRINSLTEIALTKLDILSGFESLNVNVAYELDGERISYFPSDPETLARCRPIYETLPGWSEDITAVRSADALPANARYYVDFVASQVDLPIRMVSVGPARDQIVFLS